ncbi:MAG: hypothetical protein KA736_02925 [Crocinitomicaceae bacterium]|nr:hypothetical protein [Crocinitomicaceae bacterium]MBP6032394.1 hypothetical protein [Crocinitomicaceae bacterium]
MKTIILSFFSILFSTGVYAQFGVIGQPEFNVLYLGYDNFIKPIIPSNEEISLDIDGAIAVKALRPGEENGYYVRPLSSDDVTITLSSENANGEIKNYGTFKYMVKNFPPAELQTLAISKASGTRLRVSMGASSPLMANFHITGGEIILENESIVFKGDVISPSLIEKAKTGTNVKIKVNYIRIGNEQFPNTITSILEVVE